MRLAELQRAMQQHVLGAPSHAAAALEESDIAEAHERLGIYRSAYTARLTEALATTFPKVCRALGAERFAQLCSEFARKHPSTYASVRYYGAALPDFLRARHRGIKAEGLYELATWEWASAAAFDAADVDAPLPADLSRFPPECWPSLRFIFSPSVRRVRLSTNALQWQRADEALPARWRRTHPTEWLLWRRELAVYFRSLPADEARALDRARGGARFEEICAALAQTGGEEHAALRAATLLRTWRDDHVLIGAEL